LPRSLPGGVWISISAPLHSKTDPREINPDDPLGDGGYYGPLIKPITLAEAGIDKHLADRARRAAAMQRS
jgi:hypothetical protein